MPIVTISKSPHGYLHEIQAPSGHNVLADVATSLGGSDLGPTPHELALGSLGACTGMTLQMVARRKGWDLQKVTITVTETLVDDPNVTGSKIVQISESITLEGNLDQTQITALHAVAIRCPVYQLFNAPKLMLTSIVLTPPFSVPSPTSSSTAPDTNPVT